jgi:hypothetical protein
VWGVLDLVTEAALITNSHLSVRCTLIVAAFASAYLCGSTAHASDFFHDCTALNASGKSVLGTKGTSLVLKSRTGGTPLQFQVVERTLLRELLGYCIGKGKRYRFRTEIYGLTLEFEADGTKMRERFRCEMLADGTPAGITCEREIRSIDWHAPSFDSYR